MIDGMMQIAVFNPELRRCSQRRGASGRDACLTCSICSRWTEATTPPSPRGTPSWFGQSIFNSTTTNVAQETCRDLTHTEDSISGTILAAETDWIQGGSLYTDAGSVAQQRIVGAMNVMAGVDNQGGGQTALLTAPTDYCTWEARARRT